MAVTPPIPPNTNNVSVTGPEDTPVNVPLSGTDLDGVVVSFNVVTSLPANGVLYYASGPNAGLAVKVGDAIPATSNAATIVFVPNQDWNGVTTFQYQAKDNANLVDTTPATATITITPVNDPPETLNASATGAEDATGITLLIKGTDVDGTVASFTITKLPTDGVLKDTNGNVLSVGSVVAASGNQANVVFVPNANWNGTNTFQYAAKDNSGASDATPATGTVTVTPVNDPPDAIDDKATTPEDTAITFNPSDLLGNDTDVDNDPLTITSVQGAVGGTVKFEGGVITFTPNADYNGPASFTYTISDGKGGTDTATVNINVTPVNDPPTTEDASATGAEDTPVTLTLKGADVDGAVASFTITKLPTDGVLKDANGNVLSVGSTVTASGNQATVTFVPNQDWNGTNTFEYAAKDNSGASDATPAVGTITLTPVNDPPDAKDDTGSTDEDKAVTFTVGQLLGNDTDPENDTLTVTSVQDAVNGTVTLVNGVVTFTPNADYNGPASFTYTVSDGKGGTDTATVNINVAPVNDPPETDDVSASGDEDTPVSVVITGADVDGAVASFVIKSLPANGVLSFNGAPVSVGQEIPATGNAATLVFTPTANWNGQTAFDYASKDNGGLVDATPGSATITVNSVNDPPATDDVSATGVEDASKIPVALHGSDVDGSVAKFVITSLPANGTLTDINGVAYKVGDTVDATAGSANVYFTPNANWNGDTSFKYAAQDDGGLNDPTPATATVTVTSVNDAPETNPTSATGLEDAAGIPVALSGSDIDGSVAGFTITSLPGYGKLLYNGAPVTVGQVIPASGGGASVTFVPNANWNGDTSFTYASRDNEGLDDGTPATATITVTPVNDPPETDNTAAAGVEDQAKIEVRLSGSDIDGTVSTFTIKDLPANGKLTDANGNTLSVGSTVTADASGQASVYFTPNANWSGDASFHYASNDNDGLQDPTPATATINVAAVNDPPETDNVSATGAEDSAGIPVLLHGSDVDGTVASFQINSLPANGVLMYNGAAVTVGQVIPASANGATVTFVPTANWNGVTDFGYTATDNQGAADPTPGVATITVTSVNDGPDTGNSSAVGIKGALNIGLTMTGTDIDGTVVSFTIKSLPSNGTLSNGQGKVYAVGDVVAAVNGKADIFFTPTAAFTGTVTFNYAANDNDGAQDPTPGVGTVVINAPPNSPDPKPPETNNTSATGAEDVVKLAINLTGTDTDGTVKSFVINDLPANGKLYDANGNLLTAGSVVTATGNAATVYFTPNANWNGDTSFHYASKDNDGLVDATPATASIKITSVNDGPETCDVNVCASTCADYVKVGLAGSDIDGKVVGFVITSLPTDGVLKYGSTVLKVGDVVPANAYGQASITFYPNANWDGSTTFNYASKDDGGAVDQTPAKVTIQVPHANAAPDTQAVSVTGVEDGGPVTLKITGTDSDGTVTAFKIDSLPTGGVLKFGTQVLKVGDVITATSNSATLTFTPNADWNGVTGFQYQARDNGGAYDSTPATAKITITGVNDAPTTSDVSANGCEDGGKIAICLSGADVDGKVVSFTITDLPANGVLTDAGGKVLTAGSVVTATNNGATVYFTPNAEWSGATSFRYAAKDDQGLSDPTPNTAKITVADVNDAPTTTDVTVTGVEDQTTPIKITLSGADIDGTVTGFKITTLPANGVFKDANGVVLTAGSFVSATGGQAFVYFTPKADFSGDTSFQYAAKDNGGLFDGSPATVTIKIAGVNDAPDAVNDSATMTTGTTLKLAGSTLLANDTDVDGDKLTITSVQSALHGTVSLASDGSVSFTATSGYTGAASFTYTISDGKGGTDTATVNINVKPVSSESLPTGPGVRTQGFWANNGAVYWDGEADSSSVKHSPTYANFPKAELTYKVDVNGDGTLDSNKYLLVGDFNRNGLTDNGEHTWLISLSDAKALLTTSAMGDGRMILARDVITAWLNYLSDNSMGSTANSSSPAWFVQEAVDWLSQLSGTNKTLSNGVLNTGAVSNGDFPGWDVSTSGASWTTGINLDGVAGIVATGKDVDAGAHLHAVLDAFNNTGKIGSTIWSNDGDL